MNGTFGPWAAGLDMPEPSRLHLSTFWKSRLLRLNGVNCGSIAIPRRALFALIGVALLLCGIPGMNTVPAKALSAGKQATSEKKSKSSAKLAARRTGSLYVRGFIYRDGRLAGMWIVKVDPKTGQWKKLLSEGNEAYSVRISPDGQTMAYSHKGQIWSADTDTAGSPGKISDTGGLPLWSPDGKTIIATQSKRTDDKKNDWSHETWRFNSAGDNPAPLDLPKNFQAQDWSPNGKWLIRGGLKKGLWLISPDGKQKKYLTKARGHLPRFSPDGKQIVYGNGWEHTLHVTDVNGTKVRRVFQADELVYVGGANWSRDGRRLATLLLDMELDANGKKFLPADPLKTNPRIAIVDVDTGKHRVLDLPVVDGVTFYPTDLHDWR